MEEWKDCEELKPQSKEKWTNVDKKREDRKASNGVVCRGQQVSMHDMWQRQQAHKDARKMHRTEILGQ